MSIKCFVLSTPDLKSNTFPDWLASTLGWPIYSSGQPLKHSRELSQAATIELLQKKISREVQKCWYEAIPLLGQASVSFYQDDLDALKAQLEGQSCLIDDPLLCHSLPVWKTLTEQPKILLLYSQPLECALSLQRNWRMPLAVGLALWESYIINACKSSVEQDYLLVSSQELNSNEINFKQVLSHINNEPKQTLDKVPQWSPCTPMPSGILDEVTGSEECVQAAQQEILRLLKKGDVKSIASRELSYPSTNTLEYYGQLRASLEMSNANCDVYKSEIIEQKNKLAEAIDTEKSNSTKPEDNEMKAEKAEATCSVKVQIKGMDTLEFLSHPDSPVLEMLRTHIAQDGQDELIFLNYGETGEETLYFMSSSLLSFETERI